jgi:hypothetical protein
LRVLQLEVLWPQQGGGQRRCRPRPRLRCRREGLQRQRQQVPQGRDPRGPSRAQQRAALAATQT